MTPCAVCGFGFALASPKARNAIPANVPICADCLAVVGRRQLGIVRRADGTLDITDGRKPLPMRSA